MPGAVVVRADVPPCVPEAEPGSKEPGRGHPGSCPEVLDGTLPTGEASPSAVMSTPRRAWGVSGAVLCTPAAGKAPARRARSGRIVARRPGTQGEGPVNRDANCPGANLSPRGGAIPILRGRCQDGAFGTQHLARQQSAPGRKPCWWPRSRRPCPIAVGRAAAMSCVFPAASVEPIRSPTTICPCGAGGEWRISKCGQEPKVAERGCRKATPGP
jgi:hypothetical protein